MPSFEQTFRYDAAAVVTPTPGVTVRSSGPLVLDAKGGLALTGGATWFFAGPLGIEARYDSLAADLEATGATYDVSVRRSPLPPIDARLELHAEGLKLEQLHPVSLNLRLATKGAVRFSLSGGVSYLGPIRIAGTLVGSLASTGGASLPFGSARVGLSAEAAPNQADNGQYGADVGLALQIRVAPHVALAAEARGFVFKDRDLVWKAAAAPSNLIEEALQRELLARLEPIRFTPTFFSVTGGLALRF